MIVSTAIRSDLQANLNIGLFTSKSYIGDTEAARRVKIAAERLGWKVTLDEDEGINTRHDKLDFSICFFPNCKVFNKRYPNYLMIFAPTWYLNEERKLHRFYEKYNGYLLTINDINIASNTHKRRNKQFYQIPFYPTVYSIPYKESVLEDLVVMLPMWGNRVNDPKFITLYKLLNKAGFAKFYGIRIDQNATIHSLIDTENYMGVIPFDGKSVIDILQKHGITLVFHSDMHNKESIPSSRIFEAAAASTIIISDENAFVKKHFSNSVFYIDTSLSGESIFNQIQDHLFSIFQNPENALEMAKNAHQIFITNFTMENQLLQLQAMHNKVISKKKF